jgi:hypothetical protein
MAFKYESGSRLDRDLTMSDRISILEQQGSAFVEVRVVDGSRNERDEPDRRREKPRCRRSRSHVHRDHRRDASARPGVRDSHPPPPRSSEEEPCPRRLPVRMEHAGRPCPVSCCPSPCLRAPAVRHPFPCRQASAERDSRRIDRQLMIGMEVDREDPQERLTPRV